MALVHTFKNSAQRTPAPEADHYAFPSFSRAVTFQGQSTHSSSHFRPAHLPTLDIAATSQIYDEDEDIPICTPVVISRPLRSPSFALQRTETFCLPPQPSSVDPDAFARAQTYPAEARYNAGVPMKHKLQMPRSPGPRPDKARSRHVSKTTLPQESRRKSASRASSDRELQDPKIEARSARRSSSSDDVTAASSSSRMSSRSWQAEELPVVREDRTERRLPPQKKEASSDPHHTRESKAERLPREKTSRSSLPPQHDVSKGSSRLNSPLPQQGQPSSVEMSSSACQGSSSLSPRGLRQQAQERSRKAEKGRGVGREVLADSDRAKTPRRERQVRFADTVQVRKVRKSSKGNYE